MPTNTFSSTTFSSSSATATAGPTGTTSVQETRSTVTRMSSEWHDWTAIGLSADRASVGADARRWCELRIGPEDKEWAMVHASAGPAEAHWTFRFKDKDQAELFRLSFGRYARAR
jgi:hypothetical protein